MNKKILVIIITISVILLFFIVIEICNTLVSYKYEIDEPPISYSPDITLAKSYLNSKIKYLGYFLFYLILSILTYTYLLFIKKK